MFCHSKSSQKNSLFKFLYCFWRGDEIASKENYKAETNFQHRSHRRRNSSLPEEPEEVKYDAVCSMELVETIPAVLKNYHKKMTVEHKTIYQVIYV